MKNIIKYPLIGGAYLVPFIIFDLIFDDKEELLLSGDQSIKIGIVVMAITWVLITFTLNELVEAMYTK